MSDPGSATDCAALESVHHTVTAPFYKALRFEIYLNFSSQLLVWDYMITEFQFSPTTLSWRRSMNLSRSAWLEPLSNLCLLVTSHVQLLTQIGSDANQNLKDGGRHSLRWPFVLIRTIVVACLARKVQPRANGKTIDTCVWANRRRKRYMCWLCKLQVVRILYCYIC